MTNKGNTWTSSIRTIERIVTSRIITYKNLGTDEFSNYETEFDHKMVYTRERFVRWLRWLPDMRLWNFFMCFAVLGAILGTVATDAIVESWDHVVFLILDTAYNLVYLVYIAGIALSIHTKDSRILMSESFGLVADAITYVRVLTKDRPAIICCYLIRLFRPLEYLCSVKDFAMKGSVVGTTFKWTYLILTARIMMTLVIICSDRVTSPSSQMNIFDISTYNEGLRNASFMEIFVAFYTIDTMFVPVGRTTKPHLTDADELICLVVVMTGCLMVSGAAVAALSLVFSLYMMPKEQFLSRYRLIMKELETSHVETGMRQTVQKFYEKYWMKQHAVSSAALLKKLPPSLYNEIITDIYFEAIQKCAILRNLPSYFISQIAKEMTTIHYIPGDTIIQRSMSKKAMYYIMYGDVEMVTAEDDRTPILRFTRGTVLTPGCGGVVVACGRSHVAIRAATFCTAYKLNAADLWRATLKQSRESRITFEILIAFYEHLERIKHHYRTRPHPPVNYLSSIYHFKMGLKRLKETRSSITGDVLLADNIFLEVAGSYIMRNKVYSEDPICIRQSFPCILQPTSSLLDVWNVFVICCTLCISVTHPYTLAFKDDIPQSFVFFDQLILVIFVMDLIVTLSTSEKIEEGQLVAIGQTVVQQASKPRFLTDLMAVLPVFNFIGDGRFAGMNKLIKIPKIFYYLAYLENQCVYYSDIIRFLSYTLVLGCICYLVAAINQAIMCHIFQMCDVTNITSTPHWGTLTAEDGETDTIEMRENRRFWFGLYWSISLVTLTSHCAVFEPEFVQGSSYTLVLLEIVVLAYIFFEAVHSATIMVTSAMQDDYEAAIRVVVDFMERNAISAEVSKRFITYLELSWYTDHAYSLTHKKQIFHDLPPHVYQDIVAKQHRIYIRAIPFMKYVPEGELTSIASKLKLFYTSPNEILLNTGDVTSELYIVKRGICEKFDPVTKKVIKYLKAKDHFGVSECILGIPVYSTIRAATHVQIFALGKKHLTNIMKYPCIVNTVETLKKSKEYQAVQAAQYERFMKYQPLKCPPNRSVFRVPKIHEKDDLYQLPFKQLGFLSILRYVFPRFTIRPDGKYLQRYEWFRAFCALCSAMLFPNYSYLVVQFPYLVFMKYFLDISAYYDICQRLVVGYYNDNGVLVYHPASTAAHYIKTAFLMDLMACMPLETLEPLRLQSATEMYNRQGYRIMRFHQYMMFNRTLQLYRFYMTMNSLTTYLRQDLVLVLKYLPLFVTLVNVVTSLILLYTVLIHYTVLPGGETLWQITHRLPRIQTRHYMTPWVDVYAKYYGFNITESPWNLHLAVYFWVTNMLTTAGYTSIYPTNEEQLACLFISMWINKMLYTFFSVRVISTRANVNKAQCTFQEHMRDLNAFLEKENLNEELRWTVESYYGYNWYMVGGIDSRSVLKMCDQVTLRSDTILQMYGTTFSQCPFLSADTSLLRILSRDIQDVHFEKDTEIIRDNDVTSVMYFVSKGSVRIRGTLQDTCFNVTLPKGSAFGNLDPHRIRIPLKALALTNVHLLMIASDVFHNIINDFPQVREKMQSLREQNQCFIKSAGVSVAVKKQKRKRIYSSVVENLERNLLSRHPAVLLFLIFVSLVVIFLDMFHAAFGESSSYEIIILYTADALFLLKLPLRLVIVKDEEPLITKKLKEIRGSYLKVEFIFDIISLLPFELISFAYPINVRSQYFAWWRLNRLFRIPTVYVCLSYYSKRMNINLIFTAIATVTIWFFISMHVGSCVWWYIGSIEEMKQPKSSWQYSPNGTSMCENPYICSFFFMLTTFTHNGYSEIKPRQHSEIMYVLFIQILSTVVLMIYVGEFSNTIQLNNFRVFQYYSNFLELQDYLKNNKTALNLLELVNRYSLYLWRESRGIQIPKFLSIAPDIIRLKIMEAAYQKSLEAHPVFCLCEKAFLRQLVGCFKVYAYVNEMYIVREEDITDSMYFIHKGSVVQLNNNQTAKKYYHAGQYFGSGLIRRKPYTHSFKTVTMAQILILSLDDWEYLLQFFPKSRRAMYGSAGEDSDAGPTKRSLFTDSDTTDHTSSSSDGIQSSSTKQRTDSTTKPVQIKRSGFTITVSEHTKKALAKELEYESKCFHKSRGSKKSISPSLSRVSKLPINHYSPRDKFQHRKSTTFNVAEASGSGSKMSASSLVKASTTRLSIILRRPPSPSIRKATRSPSFFGSRRSLRSNASTSSLSFKLQSEIDPTSETDLPSDKPFVSPTSLFQGERVVRSLLRASRHLSAGLPSDRRLADLQPQRSNPEDINREQLPRKNRQLLEMKHDGEESDDLENRRPLNKSANSLSHVVINEGHKGGSKDNEYDPEQKEDDPNNNDDVSNNKRDDPKNKRNDPENTEDDPKN